MESYHLGGKGALRMGAGLIPRREVAIVVAIPTFSTGLITAGLYAALIVMPIPTSVIGPVLLHRLFRMGLSTDAGAPVEPEATGV